MKTFCLATTLVLVSSLLRAQGTFIYDQQSADESHYQDGGAALGQQPLGQSFSPSLNSVGFIRIYVYGGGGSGTFVVNLRSDSITGSILASSSPVTLTAAGPSNFLFSSPVTVTPGAVYYFQPEFQTGSGGWGVFVAPYNYSGGVAFVDGLSVPAKDFWFREGIVVPEPCSPALLLLGGGFLLWARRKLSRWMNALQLR